MSQIITVLPRIGALRVEGEDAETFLQAHVCNDVAAIGDNTVQLSGYCSPKGRLLAVFHIFRDDQEAPGFLLVMPREVIAAVAQRLNLFAQMIRPAGKQMIGAASKTAVTLTDVSDQFSIYGVSGNSNGAALGQWFAFPSPGSVQRSDAGYLLAAGFTTDRWLLAIPATYNDADLSQWLADNAADGADAENNWLHSEIMDGLPIVFTATQDEFVPQMVNMQVLGGLSFTKGCYPGQEIVARMQYLGKLKRRMERFRYNGDIVPPSTPIENGSGNVVGSVVAAAAAPDTSAVDMLAVVRIESIDDGLKLAGETPIDLSREALPYQNLLQETDRGAS